MTTLGQQITMREYPGLKIVEERVIAPSGIWGIHEVVMEFPIMKRPSRGWRKHIRRRKAER